MKEVSVANYLRGKEIEDIAPSTSENRNSRSDGRIVKNIPNFGSPKLSTFPQLGTGAQVGHPEIRKGFQRLAVWWMRFRCDLDY